MLVRAGASNREMATAMGVNIRTLFTLVFGVGAALCAIAGAMLGPILAVQVGMGESILILAFVVIVIGGIGSIRGALVGALLVGMVDTIGRAFLPIAVPRVPAAGLRLQPRPGGGVDPHLRADGGGAVLEAAGPVSRRAAETKALTLAALAAAVAFPLVAAAIGRSSTSASRRAS